MSELFQRTFSITNIQEAISHLSKKKDTCGLDGIYLSQLQDYWNKCGEEKMIQLQSGTYEPETVEEYELLTRKGKKRYINKMSSADRLFTRAMVQQLQAKYDERFSPYSFAYQNGKSTYSVALQAAEYMASGSSYVVQMDIENYFDSINLKKLERTMQDFIEEEDIIRCCKCFLYPKIMRDGDIQRKEKGILQGSPLSPFMSNLYLHGFDLWMESQGIRFCRFADDITIFVTSMKEAQEIQRTVQQHLKEQYALRIQQSKTRTYPAEKCEMLGFSFARDKKTREIKVKRIIPEFTSHYNNWHTSALCKVDRNYHLVNKGILSRKDYTLLFENENKKKYLPVECVETIGIYSDITFQSGVFEYLAKKQLRVILYDRYGNYIGSFTPANPRNKYIKTLEQQMRAYFDDEKRLDIAKRIIIAGIHNMRANLRYYFKKRKAKELKGAEQELTAIIDEMTKASSINELMMTEARARQKYYQSFNYILQNQEFQFTKRTKRPPQDELNALISFGNTWLYQRLATEIYKTSLDIRFGFLHAANRRAQSLNLDLSEIFKPIIIDRCIISLINKGIIKKKEHFETLQDGAVYLNREGKRLFIVHLEGKLYQKITLGNRQYTYYTIMKNDIDKLVQHLNNGTTYKPYKYTN